ncbi:MULTISPECIES: YcjF family protein [Prochlorococcus]|uniref:Membrane associated GTPase n=1 Tax=Prochlorococcus marinus (strain SARG / CCMP1375 / SS120) TaxID=167539 RepID=Q7VBN1_PROMA|nr:MULTISPECIES: YcjF family protein [Prochlorococcus]AAQ00106.1 Membrane associated GTPase [Prochlorococcus marinus subsp. marinus str. CCMP1375]KGG13902.1 Membrane associated GTPase [Prochlorococcus marinus str. LG]KGG19035.1 Membrane associated GTPase [Prochlorococcus marinus str. SS2]KGG23425.1 Membrane associated GTPase [Prochlorococcus marinus str. SS35]KGG32339.1 Membrane associated GTPase [Prochlorococcus marinus str. SS51]
MKNFLESFKIPSLPVGKVGILLGSFIAGQWVVSDLIHIPSGGIAVFVAGAGILFLSKPSSVSFNSPSTVKGWIKRCNAVLKQFEFLEEPSEHFLKATQRAESLQEILTRDASQSLSVLSTKGIDLPQNDLLQSALKCSSPLNLSCSASLPIDNQSWEFPSHLFEQDLILYYLPLPLRAVDLLWLEKVPQELPSWIAVNFDDQDDWPDQLKALQSQLPERWINRVLKCDESLENMKKALTPVRRCLEQPKKNVDQTRRRLLSRLHSSWQADLEGLRRTKFRDIQNRSQWLVAGAVFASPVPSTDLLSVAVVNGLMIQEMGKLWSCDVKPDLLNAVARQLAIAALSQGVVEWSGQALLGVAKLHGSTWLAAGAIQAISAAYLTRVVGTSMADWMALNNGVSKPDLELLKLQAPALIAQAAEKEKVDWTSFVNQSRDWIKEQLKDQRAVIT